MAYTAKRDPAYSFGIRTKNKVDMSNPGPGNYSNIDTGIYKESAPKYSIKGSGGHDFGKGLRDMPGPG